MTAPNAPLTDEQIDEALKLCDAATLAWERLDAGCAGLLASQCRYHRPYMECPLDCNDVENALDPEHAEARKSVSPALALLPAALRELKAAREELVNLRRAVEEYLPHPNGDQQTPGNPDAWNAAMFNLGQLKEEADSLRARLAELTRERDDARAAGAWKPSEAWSEEVADETAERIAAFMDELMEANPDDWSITPDDIRAGAWRVEKR